MMMVMLFEGQNYEAHLRNQEHERRHWNDLHLGQRREELGLWLVIFYSQLVQM